MSPFEPIGKQARWRTIYELLRPLEVGDTLTYQTMALALELHPDTNRHAIQMAVRRAAKEYETEDLRAIEPVPNVGYRVVGASEHMTLAKQQQRKAGKALSRGHSKVVNVNMAELEPSVRTAFQVVAQAFAVQMDMNRRLSGRQDQMEQTLHELAGRSDRSETEIAELKARLERLEQTSTTE